MKQIKFRSADGLEIYGHLSLPVIEKPSPAVLLISGGIHGSAYQENGNYDPLHLEICNYLNREGYVTLIVDKRGSSGYGQSYKSLLDLCGDEVEDIISGGAYLRSLDSVQKGKITLHGTSRSSTTAAMAISKSNIFKAAILASGFYDIEVQYDYEAKHRADIFPTKQSMGSRKREQYPCSERSPINHVNEVKCSVLLVHGMDDKIVPAERSIDYHQALKKSGVDAELILYDKFSHFKEYSLPSHEIGKKYWDDCVHFLRTHI